MLASPSPGIFPLWLEADAENTVVSMMLRLKEDEGLPWEILSLAQQVHNQEKV
jgi:hypothetical protein